MSHWDFGGRLRSAQVSAVNRSEPGPPPEICGEGCHCPRRHGGLAAAVAKMAGALDARMSFRLAILVAGMLLADDRRTASSWFAAAGVHDDWDRFYDALISIGRQSQEVSEGPVCIMTPRRVRGGCYGHN